MSHLPDGMTLSQVNLPGTHDAERFGEAYGLALPTRAEARDSVGGAQNKQRFQHDKNLPTGWMPSLYQIPGGKSNPTKALG